MILPFRKKYDGSAYRNGWNDCLDEIMYYNNIISLDIKNMSEENVETPVVETPEVETPAPVEETPAPETV